MNRLIVIGVAVLMIVGPPVAAQEQRERSSPAAVTPEAEAALLQEDWAEVIELLDNVTPETPSPVKRLLRGHACLATNRNNESLELFASALNDADRDAWQLWADAFQNEHPDNAIAWYFKGDAQARKRQWKEAEASLKEALRKHPRCYLAWNALGVVQHAVGNTILARQFFKKATQANPSFADAHASRGTLNIHKRSATATRTGTGHGEIGGAEHWFNQAGNLSHDETPTIAVLGLGCAAYGKQLYDEARKHFDAIPARSPLWALAQRNSLAAELGHLSMALAEAREAGMTLESFELAGARRSRDPEDPPIDWIEELPDGSKIVHYVNCIFERWPPPNKGGEEESKESVGQAQVFDGAPPPLIVGAPTPPVVPPDLIRQIAARRVNIRQQIAVAPPAAVGSPTTPVGGVDAGGVKKIRTNRGRWNAWNVYGLLYDIPARSGHDPTTKPTRPVD